MFRAQIGNTFVISTQQIWSIEQPTTEQLSAVEDDSPPVEELINIAVAEIFDGGHFAAQILGANTDKLETLMQELSVHCGGAAASTPVAYKPGDLICAKFEADGQWYRAKVKRFVPSEKKVEVVYVDYGNVCAMLVFWHV